MLNMLFIPYESKESLFIKAQSDRTQKAEMHLSREPRKKVFFQFSSSMAGRQQ